MTLELLLAEFDGLIQTPADVEKLNATILDWALKGKLATQCKSDEPASELLARILLERNENNSSSRRNKKTKRLGLISNDEIPYELPHGWAWTRLGNIIQISSGKNLTSKKMVEEGGIPVYGGNGVTGFHNEYLVDKPTVVIGRVGFYCGSVHLTEAKAWVTDNAFITSYSEPNIEREFLIWLLRGTNLKENDNATAQPVISGRKIYPIVVGLPPLAEQKRIVARVDELLGQTAVLTQQLASVNEQRRGVHTAVLHQLTTKTSEVSSERSSPTSEVYTLATHFDRFYVDADTVAELKQAILQLAVQGRLVPQDERDEDAAVLLEKLVNEKARLVEEGEIQERTSEKYSLEPISAEETDYPLPIGWKWVRMGQIIYAYRGYNPPKSQFVYKPQAGYVRFVQITDFKTDERAVYVPISNRNKMISRGEIIMAAYRHIGKVSREMEGAFNVALCKVMEIPPINRDFVEKLIGTSYVTGELLKASERAHIPSMHLHHFLSLVVPLPPIGEQKRIVAKVDELFALCDQLAGQLTTTAASRTQLLEAVLAQA